MILVLTDILLQFYFFFVTCILKVNLNSQMPNSRCATCPHFKYIAIVFAISNKLNNLIVTSNLTLVRKLFSAAKNTQN